MSIVITNAASRTASAGVSARFAPSAASTRALSGVRFHTRTWKPAFSRLRAIGAPMMPVPRTATRSAIFVRAEAGTSLYVWDFPMGLDPEHGRLDRLKDELGRGVGLRHIRDVRGRHLHDRRVRALGLEPLE